MTCVGRLGLASEKLGSATCNDCGARIWTGGRMSNNADDSEFSCDVCGFSGARESVLLCRNAGDSDAGCCFGRHIWCFLQAELAQLSKTEFSCEQCRSRTDHAAETSTAYREEISRPATSSDTASQRVKATSTSGGRVAKVMTNQEKLAGPSGTQGAEPVVKPPETTAHSQGKKLEAKVSNRKLPTTSRVAGSIIPGKRAGSPPVNQEQPPLKKKALPTMYKTLMTGLKDRTEPQNKDKDSKDTPQRGQAQSESGSENRLLLLNRMSKEEKALTKARAQARQLQTAAASLRSQPVWQGKLQVAKVGLDVALSAYGLAGNAHAMDAAVRLPKGVLAGEIDSSDICLDMSPVEAADLAALVFKGTSPRDQKGMSDLQNPEFDPETSIIQVSLGDDRPIWLALIPVLGPDSVYFGAIVRYDKKWTHSEENPGKKLLKKDGRVQKRQKVEWPDHVRHTRRSSDCERGPGAVYGQMYIPTPPTKPLLDDKKDADDQLPKKIVKAPPPGPLSSLSVFLVGFQRDHEKIQQLRKELNALEAKVFTNPWPGCVNVLCFPELMIERDLGAENNGPGEMQPIRDFLRSPQARAFLKIDYLHACCQLKRVLRPEEEVQWQIRELWPEGIHILADSSSLLELLNGKTEDKSLFDQLMRKLNLKEKACKIKGSIWHLSIGIAEMTKLEQIQRSARYHFEQWMSLKRCIYLDKAFDHGDRLRAGVRAAHFFRYYCRHTIVLVQESDSDLYDRVDATKTIHPCRPSEILALLESL